MGTHPDRSGAEQPFHTEIAYYEERAAGIASVNGVALTEARRDLARRHGFPTWAQLRRYIEALKDGTEPAGPFMLAFRAIEARDRNRLSRLVDGHSELIWARGTNGNDLLGMAATMRELELVRLPRERRADPNRRNDYGWTALHQAGYQNNRELARLLLDAGADTGLSSRGEGGTPVVAALFWGHHDVVELLGPGAVQSASRRRARSARSDPGAGRHSAGRGSARLLSAARRLSRLAAFG